VSNWKIHGKTLISYQLSMSGIFLKIIVPQRLMQGHWKVVALADGHNNGKEQTHHLEVKPQICTALFVDVTMF